MLSINKKQGNRMLPVIQNKLELLAGGISVDPAALPDNIVELKEGAFMAKDTGNGLWYPVKAAKLYADAGSTDTQYQVEKNHLFKAGDYIGSNDPSSDAQTITSIDRSNADYDVIHVDTTLGTAFTASNGVYLVQADATGSNWSKKYTPEVVTAHTENFEGEENPNLFISALVRGTVLEARLPYAVAPDHKTDLQPIIQFQ